MKKKLIKYSAFILSLIGLSLILSPFSGKAQNTGELDLTFRPNFIEPPNILGILIQPDGKILVCGTFSTVNGAGYQGIVRLKPDGSIDDTFSPVTINPTPTISTIALQSDGRILIGGLFSAINGVPRTSFARLDSDGSLDPSLGSIFDDWRGEIVESILPLPNGQIMIGGQISFTYMENGLSNGRQGIARISSTGSLDRSFGLNRFTNPGGETLTMALQNDGRIIAGGGFVSFNGNNTIKRLTRLNTDGTVDTSFSGVVDSTVFSLTTQDDGKIVIGGGFSTVNGVNRRGIARLSIDGALDSLFNPGAGLGGGATRKVKIQSDGKIIIGGNFLSFDGVARTALARLNSDGSLDNGVNPILTRTDSGTGFVIAIDVQNDGKVLIGGTFNSVDGLAQNAIARLAPVSPTPMPTPTPTPSPTPTPTPTPTPNQIDDPSFFVRQHYLDFLNREPDSSGLQFWTSEITGCGPNAQCNEIKRINVSAAFFLSIEFQQTGNLVYKMYKAGFGNLPGKPVPVQRAGFIADSRQIGSSPTQVIVGVGDWQTQLENNKQAFALDFVQRSAFQTAHGSQSAATYVDSLFANAGATPSSAERNAAISAFGGGGSAGQAAALRSVAESNSVSTKLSNEAFVLMQYFGYLQRDPDAAPDSDFSGYNFWLSKLNQFNGNFVQAEMVKAFISSTEYRQRFGQ